LQRSQDESRNGAVATHIFSFEPPAKLAYTDHLKYFLYGGMVYMALKEWNKARNFLNIVISSPVVISVSRIMVEAYKKWVLVNLLESGTVRMAPVCILAGNRG
jgi:COP9 signalosome complex subunit 3